MEPLIISGLLAAIIGVVVYLMRKPSGDNRSSRSPGTMSSRSEGGNTQTQPATYRSTTLPGVGGTGQPINPKQVPQTFRPKAGPAAGSQQTIRFDQTVSQQAITFKQPIHQVGTAAASSFAGLVDALTGVPLQLQLGLFQCQRCRVFYHTQSFEVIRVQNGGKCVSCGHTTIVSVTGGAKPSGQNAEVRVITLGDYQNHVGRVITFEGRVCKVLSSRRGTDYAVMFEDRSWTRGFKMVAFGGNIGSVGGAAFLLGLEGRRVRVRGLLINHETFGYEIIISDRAMVLSVQ